MRYRLSSREAEVLHLSEQGYTTQEVADKLFVSYETVKTHKRNIIAKLGAKNLIHASWLYNNPTLDQIESRKITSTVQMRRRLRTLILTHVNELNDELDELLREAMKDSQ